MISATKESTLRVGTSMEFVLRSILPDGTQVESSRNNILSRIHEGGFFGYVLFFEDAEEVIKVARPLSPLRRLARSISWDFRKFPSEVDETTAQKDYVGMILYHKILHAATDGKYYAPEPLGYDRINGSLAQGIEFINGRPIRLDDGGAEYQQAKLDQDEITKVGLAYGFELAGQAHPDNPLGLPNIVLDLDRGCKTQQDTLPAMLHKPFLGIFSFKFHKELKAQFESYLKKGEVTFNRVHTSLLRTSLERDRNKFDPEQYQQILDYADLYDQLQRQTEINGKTDLDLLEPIKAAVLLGREIASGVVKSPFKFLGGVVNLFKYRNFLAERLEKAYHEGFIGAAELKTGLAELKEEQKTSRNKGPIYTGLYAYYQSLGLVRLSFMGLTYFGLAADTLNNFDHLFTNLALGGLSEGQTRGITAIMKVGGTLALSVATRANLRRAAMLCWIPVVGDHLAIPVQAAKDFKEQNRADFLPWHYTVRELMAKMAPFAGNGSDAHFWLYEKIGSKIEKLGK